MPGRSDTAARDAALALVWSAVAFYVGDRLGALAEPEGAAGIPGAIASLPAEIALDPLSLGSGPLALALGTVMFATVWAAHSLLAAGRRSWVPGGEYGTARLGTVFEGQAYRDMASPENNVILTKHLGIAISRWRETRGGRVRTSAEGLANRNVIVIGGSGSNKTTGYVEPNLLQVGCGRDVVVTDPKGTCIGRCGMALAKAGVEVRWLNTVNPELSDVWSIFAGVRTRRQAVSWIEMFFSNTNNGRQSSDPVWDNGEKLFALSLILLMLDWMPRSDFTFRNFVRLKGMCEVPEEGPTANSAPSALDLLFGQIETGLAPAPAGDVAPDAPRGARSVRASRDEGWVPTRLVRNSDGVCPADWEDASGRRRRGMEPDEDDALAAWKEFRSGAGRTLRSFVVSLNTRMLQFEDPGLYHVLAGEDGTRDDMRLDLLGQREDALGNPVRQRVVFVTTSDYDTSLNSILGVFMWQAINLPMAAADSSGAGRLPRPLSVILDEFRNVGKLGSFPETVATVRSRNIDVSILLQSLSQLEEVYGKENAETIRENCATTVYLGGSRSYSTSRALEEAVGKQTVSKRSESTRPGGVAPERSTSVDVVGRPVLDAHEIATLDSSKALVLIGSKEAIVDDKSLVWEHPRYDPVFMADPDAGPPAFDYAAWRDAGRPLGEEAARWERERYGHDPARARGRGRRRRG